MVLTPTDSPAVTLYVGLPLNATTTLMPVFILLENIYDY